MVDRLGDLGVTRVVMEATRDYWKPPFYLLEAAGFDVWLVNAKDVKHLPCRPKTDVLDAAWLCKIAERQIVRPSFVPPPPIRLLRDLTRYRVALLSDQTAEKNRQFARTAIRRKNRPLEEAFDGRFTDHHAFRLGLMLARIDALIAGTAPSTPAPTSRSPLSLTRSTASTRSLASGG
jgi:transposase